MAVFNNKHTEILKILIRAKKTYKNKEGIGAGMCPATLWLVVVSGLERAHIS